MDILDTIPFADARELAKALTDLVSVARWNGCLNENTVIHVVAPDGQVCSQARLVRERLTDGSHVLNVALELRRADHERFPPSSRTAPSRC